VEGRVPACRFAGGSFLSRFFGLCASQRAGTDAVTTSASLKLSRLESRVFSLYCSSQASDAGCRRSASNEPGGVATPSRHFFIAPFALLPNNKVENKVAIGAAMALE
jgi:hypothetical protein